MKQQRFLEEDWDYVIVLDAARYDVFEEIYDDYLSGDLEKRKSKASATPEWVTKVFDGRHNLNYFSTNPFINSIGLPLNEIGAVDYETVPSRHITNIIDLWEEDWDAELGTVRPEKVNERVLEELEDLPDRRTVIHYMQPHAPFLGRGKSRINRYLQSSFSELKQNGSSEGKISEKMVDTLPDVIGRLEETETAQKIGFLSSLGPGSLLEVVRNDTEETLRKYHEENLREAMEQVCELVDELDGDVVVTSDHGEAFGEEGVWGHHIETHIPALVEVPWLEVEGVKK